jgi:dynein light chain 1
MKNLKILSLSRNQIKHIRGLDEVGQTLEQLWLSYNLVERLENLNKCERL